MNNPPHLTIAYMTNRHDCRIEWFADSLWNQWKSIKNPLTIVVVDYWAEEFGRRAVFLEKLKKFENAGVDIIHVTPKPTVWQGKHRLTKEDYFAAANARNTAICLAKDGWLAYVDDLSVLLDGWLERVLLAMKGNYIVLGTYEKVLDLKVEGGKPTMFTSRPVGMDSRMNHFIVHHSDAANDGIVQAGGSWLYGCSLAAPVEAFLSINGWDENCDSMGAEDYPCGYMMERRGYKLMFDTKMKTFESEELHHVEHAFKRIDKPNVKGQKDASNAYLTLMMHTQMNWAPNYFQKTIADERKRVLETGKFTCTLIPEHDWRDGQPIREM